MLRRVAGLVLAAIGLGGCVVAPRVDEACAADAQRIVRVMRQHANYPVRDPYGIWLGPGSWVEDPYCRVVGIDGAMIAVRLEDAAELPLSADADGMRITFHDDVGIKGTGVIVARLDDDKLICRYFRTRGEGPRPIRLRDGGVVDTWSEQCDPPPRGTGVASGAP